MYEIMPTVRSDAGRDPAAVTSPSDKLSESLIVVVEYEVR